MTRTYSALLLVASVVTLAAVAQEDPALRLPSVFVIPAGGEYHGGEIPYSAGPGWLALVADRGSTRLAPVTLHVGTVFDSLFDTEQGPYSGKSVAVEPPQTALVLLKGESLQAGVVAAASVDGDHAGLSAKILTVKGRSYTLALNDECGRVEAECQWILSDGKIKQTIYKLAVGDTLEGRPTTESSSTGLIWAGDLDHDGQLDLVVDVSDHYNAVAQIRVLLSSVAPKGQLVLEVGSFSAVGC